MGSTNVISLRELGCGIECQQNKEIQSLRQEYQDKLNNYLNAYKDSLTNPNDQSKQAIVMSLNNDLQNILTQLTDKIQSISELINQKELEADSKNQRISQQASQIENIESDLSTKNAQLKTRQAQITFAEKRFAYSRLIMWVLIALNIILFVFLVGLLFARFKGGPGLLTEGSLRLSSGIESSLPTLSGGSRGGRSFLRGLAKYTGLKF
jgi:uncharacterized phage infection (PIP) family protein YhgE